MTPYSRFIPLLTIAVLVGTLPPPASAAAPDGWLYRFDVEAKAADAVQAAVYPCAADVGSLAPVVIGPDGTQVGSMTLKEAAGEPMKIVFDGSGAQADKPFSIYLVSVNNAPKTPAWTPAGGFLVSTKNLDKKSDIPNAQAFKALWTKAEVSDQSMVPAVRNAFPFHRPLNAMQVTYTKSGAPLALHRYVGKVRIPAPKLDRIADLKKKHKAAVARLEQIDAQIAAKKAEIETFKKEDAGPTRIKLAERQLANLVRGALPRATSDAKFYAQASYEVKVNQYEFYTLSTGTSFVLIDGKVVADTRDKSQAVKVNVSGGRKRKGAAMFGTKLQLKPGEHKLEYWHAASDANHEAIMAWRPPAVRMADVMTGNIGSLTHGKVVVAERAGAQPMFSWRIVNDLRFPGAPDLIDVRFRAWPAAEDATYKWDFGDGTVAEGATASHLFLATGKYPVTLNANGKTVSHDIFAHVRAGPIQQAPGHARPVQSADRATVERLSVHQRRQPTADPQQSLARERDTHIERTRCRMGADAESRRLQAGRGFETFQCP
jgi:hypothetical protein